MYANIAHFDFEMYTIPVLTKQEKVESSTALRANENDTGSSAVQVSILTARIKKLSGHMKDNRKDKHSRRGLVGLVEQRRKHLSYLKRKKNGIYENTIKTLGLRK